MNFIIFDVCVFAETLNARFAGDTLLARSRDVCSQTFCVFRCFSGAYVGPSIPLAPANVAANGGGSPLRPRTSPPPPPPPTQEGANDNSQPNHHQVRARIQLLAERDERRVLVLSECRLTSTPVANLRKVPCNVARLRRRRLFFQGSANGPSPMAALMSVADNLTSPEPVPQPPNNPSPTSRSPPTTAANAQQRSASRGSQHSPNSSGD